MGDHWGMPGAVGLTKKIKIKRFFECHSEINTGEIWGPKSDFFKQALSDSYVH